MEKNVKSSGTNNKNEKSFLNGQINWSYDKGKAYDAGKYQAY